MLARLGTFRVADPEGMHLAVARRRRVPEDGRGRVVSAQARRTRAVAGWAASTSSTAPRSRARERARPASGQAALGLSSATSATFTSSSGGSSWRETLHVAFSIDRAALPVDPAEAQRLARRRPIAAGLPVCVFQ